MDNVFAQQPPKTHLHILIKKNVLKLEEPSQKGQGAQTFTYGDDWQINYKYNVYKPQNPKDIKIQENKYNKYNK